MRLPKGISKAGSIIRGRPRTVAAIVIPAVLLLAGAGWWIRGSGRTRPAVPPADGRVLAVVEPAPRPTAVVAFSDGCLTSECHASMSDARVVHSPVVRAACDVCHRPDAGDHTYPLLEPGDGVCVRCHETGTNALFRHRALSGEGCLACHDAHSSAAPGLLAAPSVEKTCARCHPPTDGSHRHQPYDAGRCDACHDPHASDAPGLLLGGAGSDHCGTCHARTVGAMTTDSHSHINVKGSCLACHGPHATDHKGLLSADTRDQCTACHQEIGQTVAGAVVSHDAVLAGKQCLSCHAPHSSQNAVMLRDDQSAVCLGCHNKQVIAADGRKIPALASPIATAPMVHGPVASGDCAACHSVHGGTNARLLKRMNPGTLVGEFDIRNYALCFSCHDQNLVLDASGAATQFRDGAKNLHRSHLQAGERSRSCATCHAVHSGERARLIAETVTYDGSDWTMPMGFVLTADGGSCSPGCHEPLRYSRDKAVNASNDQQGGAP